MLSYTTKFVTFRLAKLKDFCKFYLKSVKYFLFLPKSIKASLWNLFKYIYLNTSKAAAGLIVPLVFS